MRIYPIYTRCLSSVSYLVASENKAAVVDPRRDVSVFTSLASKLGVQIEYVFVTHTHSDFVSGHLDLADKTGAQVIFGPNAPQTIPANHAADGDRFRLGATAFEVMHTPGHTPDSSSFLLYDDKDDVHAVFTGDTLEISRMPQPDMAVPHSFSPAEMAAMIFDSIHNKIAQLPDETLVLPCNALVSDCPADAEDGSEVRTTLGEQKRVHRVFKKVSKTRFVDEVVQNAEPTTVFRQEIAEINASPYPPLDDVIERAVSRLQAHELEAWQEAGAHILDCRSAKEFMAGHIPGAIYIGLEGDMCAWLPKVIESLNDPVVIVTPTKKHRTAITRLARVGINNVVGYLSKGMRGWTKRDISTVEFVDFEHFQKVRQIGKAIDVRSPNESADNRLPRAQLIPLGDIVSELDELDNKVPYFICCDDGYRSLIAVSLLKRAGIDDVYNVSGGIEATNHSDSNSFNWNK